MAFAVSQIRSVKHYYNDEKLDFSHTRCVVSRTNCKKLDTILAKRFMPMSVMFFRTQEFVSHLWYQAESLPNRLRLVGCLPYQPN